MVLHQGFLSALPWEVLGRESTRSWELGEGRRGQPHPGSQRRLPWGRTLEVKASKGGRMSRRAWGWGRDEGQEAWHQEQGTVRGTCRDGGWGASVTYQRKF